MSEVSQKTSVKIVTYVKRKSDQNKSEKKQQEKSWPKI